MANIKQDNKFKEHWKDYKLFLEKRGKRPTITTDKALYSWYSVNKVNYKKGLLSPERKELIASLLDDGSTYRESIKIGKAAMEQHGDKNDTETPPKRYMSQDAKWDRQYESYKKYINKSHRHPSQLDNKHSSLGGWFYNNKQLYKRGKMKPERIERFEELLHEASKYVRIGKKVYSIDSGHGDLDQNFQDASDTADRLSKATRRLEDEWWKERLQAYLDFARVEKRWPNRNDKKNSESRSLASWYTYNKVLAKAGKLSSFRLQELEKLMATIEDYKQKELITTGRDVKSKRDITFEKHWKAYKQFLEKKGKRPSENVLSRWYNYNKSRYQKGLLSPSREKMIARLFNDGDVYKESIKIGRAAAEKFAMANKKPKEPMTQDDRWNSNYNAYMDYITKYHERPSKYDEEYAPLVAWFRHNRILYQQGQMKKERMGEFSVLLVLADRYKRVNQFLYADDTKIDRAERSSEGIPNTDNVNIPSEVSYGKDDYWNKRLQQYHELIQARRPSVNDKDRESSSLARWYYQNKSLFKAGKLSPFRQKRFKELIEEVSELQQKQKQEQNIRSKTKSRRDTKNKLDDKFKRHWKAYKLFLEKRGKRPSVITDSKLYRWYNLNKSYYQKGLLTPERSAMVAALLNDGATFKESIAIGKTSAKNNKEAVAEKKARKHKTHDFKWTSQYNAYMNFLTSNHGRPSKYDEEYASLVAWFRYNRRLYRQGQMKQERMGEFSKLLTLADRYKRVNQYLYSDDTKIDRAERSSEGIPDTDNANVPSEASYRNDEHWNKRLQQYHELIQVRHRRPGANDKDRDSSSLAHWYYKNESLLKAGKLPPFRQKKFKELIEEVSELQQKQKHEQNIRSKTKSRRDTKNKLGDKFKRHWNAYKLFLEKRGKRPSVITDSKLYRWYNLNKRKYQEGQLTPERSGMIAALLDDGVTFKESIAIGKTYAKNNKETVAEKKARKHRTHDSKWASQYNAYMNCLTKNHERPSKYDEEYASLVTWFRYNRKLYRQGQMKQERREEFSKLLVLAERYKRVNQYLYTDDTKIGRAARPSEGIPDTDNANVPSKLSYGKDDYWNKRLQQYHELILAKHRRPSANDEDRNSSSLAHWYYKNKSLLKAGKLSPFRQQKFKELMEEVNELQETKART